MKTINLLIGMCLVFLLSQCTSSEADPSSATDTVTPLSCVPADCGGLTEVQRTLNISDQLYRIDETSIASKMPFVFVDESTNKIHVLSFGDATIQTNQQQISNCMGTVCEVFVEVNPWGSPQPPAPPLPPYSSNTLRSIEIDVPPTVQPGQFFRIVFTDPNGNRTGATTVVWEPTNAGNPKIGPLFFTTAKEKAI